MCDDVLMMVLVVAAVDCVLVIVVEAAAVYYVVVGGDGSGSFFSSAVCLLKSFLSRLLRNVGLSTSLLRPPEEHPLFNSSEINQKLVVQ